MRPAPVSENILQAFAARGEGAPGKYDCVIGSPTAADEVAGIIRSGAVRQPV